MKKRRNHDAGAKLRVAQEAVKGERRMSELTYENGVHPTMINQFKKALLKRRSVRSNVSMQGSFPCPKRWQGTCTALGGERVLLKDLQQDQIARSLRVFPAARTSVTHFGLRPRPVQVRLEFSG